MKRCDNCGAGPDQTCRSCSGRLLCTPTDTIMERRKGLHCEATCIWCGRVANTPEKPLPLVASRRITPAPIQNEIEKAARRA